MIRFLVDNALGSSVADGLRTAGYDAVHVRDRGLARAPDDRILELADTEGRVIVSADTDFGFLLASTGRTSPSFILMRCSDKRPAAILVLLLTNLAQVEADLDAGSVVVFEDTRLRIRRLPF